MSDTIEITNITIDLNDLLGNPCDYEPTSEEMAWARDWEEANQDAADLYEWARGN